MTSFEEIMDRVPEVAWAMPEERPDHTDLASTNEYHEDRLHKAAAIVLACWEAHHSSSWGGDYRPSTLSVSQTIIAEETEACRLTLTNGGPLDTSVCEAVRWQAVCILNLPRIQASSSAARERTERFGGDRH